MTKWLAGAAALWLLGSSGAQAQMKGLGAVEIAEAAKNHTLDYRISDDPARWTRLPIAPNMIVHKDVGANAAIGLGLANMYQRRRGSFRAGDPPVRSRKPAVSFVLKF